MIETGDLRTPSLFGQAKRIYDALCDDTSRGIFRHRLLYSITGQAGHLVDMVSSFACVQNVKLLLRIINETGARDSGTVIFCASLSGEEVYERLTEMGVRITCFCDNNPAKQGGEFKGLPVISVSDLVRYHSDRYVIIASSGYSAEIREQLREEGIPSENVIAHGDHKQYFEPFLRHSDGETFVDGGSFDGLTSLDFINWSGGFGRIYAFEPDLRNMARVRETLREYGGKIKYADSCLWSAATELKFRGSLGSESYVSDDGDPVRAVPLDEFLDGSPVSFIKMDIEGSEAEALKGAERTIRRYKPTLAICVYHKPADILDIPSYILELVPDYKFHLRHYGVMQAETVLYAAAP